MIYPVILCGGSGTRLWPLSRSSYPKQFVNFEEGKNSLFKDTLKRVSTIDDAMCPLVVCNVDHRFYAKADIDECKLPAQIIVEPIPRNTAPAITFAAFFALSKNENAVLLVVPSDQLVGNETTFKHAITIANEVALKDFLVTFGIKPRYPATGFGYIESGDPITPEAFQIKKFIEKPALEIAGKMCASGNFLWNSGMFIFKAKTYLDELRKFSPNIYDAVETAWKKSHEENNIIQIDESAFSLCPTDSIDYAVMEKTKNGAVVPLDIEWDDLGSWNAFYNIGKKDSSNNVIKGDVIQKDSHNCYLHSTGRLISTIGLNDIAVVETKDSVLVAPLSRVQEVKNTVDELKRTGRSEANLHPLVYRPWGSYESLANGNRFQVKRIIVQPGAQLSLQLHYHRAEHWIIVEGTAEVQIGDKKELLSENESTYIPIGTVHRLRNPGKVPLIVIEVQSGSYLGEDDIVRLKDDYNRDL